MLLLTSPDAPMKNCSPVCNRDSSATSSPQGRWANLPDGAHRHQVAGRRVTCAVLDVTAVGHNLSPEQWYDGLLNILARHLKLEEELEDFWLDNARLGPAQRFFAAIREVALPAILNQEGAGRLVVFIDEIDSVRSLPSLPMSSLPPFASATTAAPRSLPFRTSPSACWVLPLPPI